MLSLVGLLVPNLLDFLGFTTDCLILLIVKKLVKHLIEIDFRLACNLLNILIHLFEKTIQQVLITCTQIWFGFAVENARPSGEHQHIVVSYSAINEFFMIRFQLQVFEKDNLITDWNLRLDFEKTLEIFHSDIMVNIFKIIKSLVVFQILDA